MLKFIGCKTLPSIFAFRISFTSQVHHLSIHLIVVQMCSQGTRSEKDHNFRSFSDGQPSLLWIMVTKSHFRWPHISVTHSCAISPKWVEASTQTCHGLAPHSSVTHLATVALATDEGNTSRTGTTLGQSGPINVYPSIDAVLLLVCMVASWRRVSESRSRHTKHTLDEHVGTWQTQAVNATLLRHRLIALVKGTVASGYQ